MAQEATQNKGADVKEGEVAVETRSPRDIALEALSARSDEAHTAQIAEQIESDPGAKLIHDQIVDQQVANREQAVADGLLAPSQEELTDGALVVEPMHPAPEPKPEPLPTELQDDPLVEYIVMENDKPMFAMKVNGENMLIPLADARRQLQIGTAAEIRMTNAAVRERQINERERQLTVAERALQQRAAAPAQIQPQVPAPADLSEAELRKDALGVMNTVFSGTVEEAADELTKVLMRTRTPAAQPTPVIDTQAIIKQASFAAIGAVDARDQKKDLVKGYNSFQSEYPKIMADANLYRMADSMTDVIATEHPEWSKSEVMLEAGKRTSEWVENLKGPAPTVITDDVVVPPEDETISEHTQPPPTQTRQDRKSELVRMPQASVAAVNSLETPKVDQPLSPQQALDEVRKARGQAV